jgi:hypothetical protein
MEVVTGKPVFETLAEEEEEDLVFSYPYAFFREGIALVTTVITVMAISLFWRAPLEEMANPAKTPNQPRRPCISWACRNSSVTPRFWAESSRRRRWCWR